MADPAMAGAEINKDYQIYSSLLPFGDGRKFEDFFKNLLEFTLPCGNGKQIETIFNSFSNQSSLMATIDSPKNVIGYFINHFYRSEVTTDT
jgi:hypothetical protein